MRRPAWYLSVQRRRDVLEYPPDGGLDVSGWDLKKALGLFAKSNPPLLEWLPTDSNGLQRTRDDNAPPRRRTQCHAHQCNMKP
jgi:predicted nucleotidyltransferase